MAMLQNPGKFSTESIAHTCHCCAKTGCTTTQVHTNPRTNSSPSKADPPNDHDHQTHSNNDALTILLNEIINEISSSTNYSPQPLAHNWTQGIYTDGCKTEEIDPYHHHHQKAFRNKSHTSHGHRPGLKRNKSKGKRLTIN